LDGKTAIENIKSIQFDLILLDVQMPEMDGIQTLERIKTIDKNIPVILVSAHLTDERIERAMKLGMFDYIEKPFDIKEVKCKVERALIVKEND